MSAPDLPATSFAVIALELFCAVRQQALGLSAMEMLVARSDDGAGRPDPALALLQVQAKRGAERMAEAYALMTAMAECEDEIREVLARRGVKLVGVAG